MKRKRQRLGSYGAGTLWGVKDDTSLTLLFIDTLHSDWAVTNVGRGEIWVQHNG
jgi:hypothetical protein